MRVILADANEDVLAALRLLLEQRVMGAADAGEAPGHQVVGEARDAVSLFALLARGAHDRRCPEVILLDTRLPGVPARRLPGKLGGKADRPASSPLAELVEAIHLLCPTLRVIALSSRPNEEKESRLARVDGFICKSDPPDELLALLESMTKI